ncbi:MAG: hypothetical protein JXR64_02570 [Spirochaetales bacterium]|nr:hypothetical protein [Spirochaetales bacterium]
MRIKKVEIGGYLQLLSSAADIPNGKWAYALSRNIKRFESVFRIVQRDYQNKYIEELKLTNERLKKDGKKEINPQAYQKAKQDLIVKYSWYEESITIKEKGEDVVKKNKKQFIEGGSPSVYSKNIKKYEKESLLLDDKNVEEKEFLDRLNKDFDSVLEQHITVDIYTVSEDGVPESISANELAQFDFMLKD